MFAHIEIVQAVVRAGGYRAVAMKLGWISAAPPPNTISLPAAASLVQDFMEQRGLSSVPTFKVCIAPASFVTRGDTYAHDAC